MSAGSAAVAAGEQCLIVSPHFDDAVLSLATVLTRAGGAATVLTVHGGAPAEPETPVSDWDYNCGFLSAAEAVTVRREEDLASCALTGATAVHLPFCDGPYGQAAENEVIEAIGAHLSGQVAVWLPAGIGNQPDHLLTSTILARVISEHPVREAWVYADSPYAGQRGWDIADEERNPGACWQSRLDHFTRRGLRLGQAHETRLEPGEFRAKLGMIRCHASQLPELGRYYPGLFQRHGPLSREVTWPLLPPAT